VLVRILVFSLVLALPCFSVVRAAESVMKTLSAHVVKVADDGASLDVDFRNPVTGKIRRMNFRMDGQSGLSGIQKLRDLRPGQIVNIDYVEGGKNLFLIRHIARVKISGPPDGLEKFRGL